MLDGVRRVSTGGSAPRRQNPQVTRTGVNVHRTHTSAVQASARRRRIGANTGMRQTEMPPKKGSFADKVSLPVIGIDGADRGDGGGKRSLWQRIRSIHPKKWALGGVGVVVAIATFMGLRVLLLSNQVFVQGDNTGALALQEEIDLTALRGEGDGRVNILLIGIGGEQHTAGYLADSIIVISIEPISKEVAMLSIPRDLYVDIPEYGSAKINAAHAYGEQYEEEGAGPALLKKTVEQTLDIPLHYFVRGDFEALQEAVDAVGGVEVSVEEPIADYAYPNEAMNGFDPFVVDAGLQTFDGENALKYARSRQSTSDFDRSRRQQEILQALKQKALSVGTLTNPLKINGLLDSVGNHVRTDLSIDEIMRLVDLSKEIDQSKVVNFGLSSADNGFLVGQNIGGASALVPRVGDFSEIQSFVRSIFVDGFIREESAPITILNGSGETGKATEMATTLGEYGYQVQVVGDAASQTVIGDHIYDLSSGEYPYTLRYLEKRFDTGAAALEATIVPEGAATEGIVIVLGAEEAAPVSDGATP